MSKYLLSLVDSKPRQASQLRSLLQEARDSGVRDEKASYHDFIETLERITNELRQDPNAVAFLNRVKKTEAHDYYEVIKKPMDLGTLLKRVKNGAYKTKVQYKDDLDLIWSNCLLYNSLPSHPLRAVAIGLRQKANSLLEFVTDPVTFRQPTVPARAVSQGPGHRHMGLVAAEALWASRRDSPTSGLAFGAVPPPAVRAGPKPQVNGDCGRRQAWQREEDEDGEGEAEELAPARFQDRRALVRTADGMTEFARKYAPESLEVGGAVAGPSMPRGLLNGYSMENRNGSVAADAEERDAISVDPILVDWAESTSPLMLANGIPLLPVAPSSVPNDTESGGGARRPKRRKITKERGKGKAKEDALRMDLRERIQTNLGTLKEIKKLHERMLAMLSTAVGEVGPIDDPDEATEEPLEPLASIPPGALSTCSAGEVAYDSMQQMTSMLLAHVGFDTSQSSALHSLTEVAAQYMHNVGRTLQLYSNRFSRSLSQQDMLIQTLRTNGLANLGALEGYVHDDVEKYGGRLGELLRKLQTGYRELAEGGGREAFNDDALFARDGEAMVVGDFTNELGEDFFGLRDLGLDAELGMTALRIPTRLLRGHPKSVEKSGGTVEDATATEPEPRFVKPPPFVPLTADAIEEQIGLLQPVYLARAQHPDFALLDDSRLTKQPKLFRPKVPPSGKIPIKRKSAVEPSNAGPLPSSKKKKKIDGPLLTGLPPSSVALSVPVASGPS